MSQMQTDRCVLNAWFLKWGGMAIYVELSSETVTCQDISTEMLLITATKNVPRVWDNPSVMLYNRVADETNANLGAVTEIEFGKLSVN